MQNYLETFTIQEVSQLSDLTAHTLRFWEKELKGVIVPLRTKGGQRRYTKEHLFIIEEIKKLKRKGLRLIEIRNRLNEKYNPNDEDSQKIDQLANRIAEIVRSAVYDFFEEEI